MLSIGRHLIVSVGREALMNEIYHEGPRLSNGNSAEVDKLLVEGTLSVGDLISLGRSDLHCCNSYFKSPLVESN